MASKRRRRTWEFDDSDSLGDEPRGAQTAHQVDLHGCTVEAAERRLKAELTRCRAGGISPVLIITGKGHGSLAGRPRLLPAMERWLKGEFGRSVGVASVRKVRQGGALEVVIAKQRD